MAPSTYRVSVLQVIREHATLAPRYVGAATDQTQGQESSPCSDCGKVDMARTLVELGCEVEHIAKSWDGDILSTLLVNKFLDAVASLRYRMMTLPAHGQAPDIPQ